jgi:hypothetical protein
LNSPTPNTKENAIAVLTGILNVTPIFSIGHKVIPLSLISGPPWNKSFQDIQEAMRYLKSQSHIEDFRIVQDANAEQVLIVKT